MNLFEIENEIMNCWDQETGEILDSDRLDQLEMERDTKIENIALYIKNLTADAEALKAEKQSFAERQKAGVGMASPKSCAILGHNPMRFAWGFDEEAAECHDMKMELAQQIMVLRQQGVTHFSVACDYGVGLYAAELINVLRDNDPELMLFCVTPYEEQATKWTPELRERYFDMLVKCSHITAVYTHKQPDAQLKAYRTIIRQSDMVLAVYDPASARGDDTDKAISYARELHRPMLMIHPDTLKTTYSCVEV